MIRREYPHHTPDQVTGYMDVAYAIVKDAAVPDDWKLEAFLKAVDLLASKQVVLEEPRLGSALALPNGGR